MTTIRNNTRRRTFIKGVGAGAAASLAGCLGNGDDVVEFHFLSATPEEPEALPNAVEAFAEEEGIEIDLTMEFVGVIDGEPTFAEYQAVGDLPNLVIANAEMAMFHSDLADVSDLNEEFDLDPAYGAQIGDRQVVTPEHFVISTRYYRTDLYEEAGLDGPAETWGEHREVLEQLNDVIPEDMHGELIQANGDNTGIHLQDAGQYQTLGINFIERTGEALDDVRVSLDDEEERQAAIDIMSHFNDIYEFSPDSVGFSFFDMILTFLEETVATTNYTGRLIDNMVAEAPEMIEVTDVAEFATPEGVGPANYEHNPQIVAVPDTEHSELAKDFLRFYFDSEYYFDRLLGAGPNSVPLTQELLNDDYLQSHETWDNPLGQAYREQVNTIWDEDRFYGPQYGRTDPPSPYWNEICNAPEPRPVPQMSARGYSGEMTPEEAVDWVLPILEERVEERVPEYLD